MYKHVVHIESVDRETVRGSTSGKYTIKLPSVYKNIISAKLSSVELANTFYVFRASYGNTSFRVQRGTGTVYTITIPDGNYDAASLGTEVKSALAAETNLGNVTWTDVIVSPKTLKLNIKATVASGSANFTFDFATGAADLAVNWGLGYYLGFEKSTYVLAATTSASAGITAPNVIRPNPYTSILLEIPQLNQMDECNIGGSDGGKQNACFAKLQLNANSFDYMYVNEDCCVFNESRFPTPIGKLARLDITWRFHDGRVADFNGGEHSFTLEFMSLEPGVE